MTDLPEPLTSADCDCRGLPFMPLEVQRFLDSDLVALSTGDEFKAAVVLWAKAWSQVPAASLPSDERILAKLAGVSLTEWRGLSEMALRGWVACSDGRLYHPLVADLAIKAFAKRRGQADRANSRWAKAKAAGRGQKKPPHQHSDAAAPPPDATAHAALMQGTDKGKGREPPLIPPEGNEPTSIRVSKADLDAIWDATPRPGRERSSRREMETAVRSAAKRGHRPGEVLRGVEGYYASRDARKDGGQYAKGVHRIIAGDRWLEFAPTRPAAGDGDIAAPSLGRQRSWMEEFTSSPALWKVHERGPRPGEPGCRVSPAIQAEFGVTAATPPEVGADNLLPFPGQPERRSA